MDNSGVSSYIYVYAEEPGAWTRSAAKKLRLLSIE